MCVMLLTQQLGQRSDQLKIAPKIPHFIDPRYLRASFVFIYPVNKITSLQAINGQRRQLKVLILNH